MGLGMESGHAWGVLGSEVQCMHGAEISEGHGLRASQQWLSLEEEGT